MISLECNYIYIGKVSAYGINYKLDVHMASPPAMDANGASCTTGGILCG